MSELPETWLACTLGEVTDYGSTEKAEPDEIPSDAWVLELEDIEKDTSRILQRLTFGERKSKSTKNRFHVGDVLYGKLRPYLNKVVIAGEDGYCSTEVVPIKPSPAVRSAYLFFWLKNPVFLDYVTAVSHGLNMPRLGTDAGRAAPFVLAPFDEQKRVADKLETVLSRVDACRDRLNRVPVLLRRFRQSVLAAATSGQLTKSGVQDFSTRWKKEPFENLLAEKEKLSYGVLKPGDSDPSGVPMYRVVDIGEWGKQNDTKPSYISQELSDEFKRTIIEEGDILLSVMATIGRSMVATKEMAGANVNRAIAVVKPDRTKVDSRFLNYYLLSPDLVSEFEKRSIGSAQLRINLGDLRTFVINLPPFPEQQEIVRRVEALFAFADQIEISLAQAGAQIANLTPAVLAKAFRGELVPQDPNDEPASVLLERFRAQRPLSSVSPKRRRTETLKRPRAPKDNATMTKSRFDDDVKDRPYLADLLRADTKPLSTGDLFKKSELSLVDFYKQLASEVERGFIADDKTKLEAA